MTELNRSWLVQRLQAPAQHYIDNPFSFGGGLHNGGLSSDAMNLIRPIFSFDYMGAAEFEYGAVPEALQKIAKFAEAGELVAWTMQIADVTIYVLSPQDWRDDIMTRITGWAEGLRGDDYSPTAFETKERVRLSNAIWPKHTWDTDTLGWLELDNGYMFFIDKAMWTATANIFSITTIEEEDE